MTYPHGTFRYLAECIYGLTVEKGQIYASPVKLFYFFVYPLGHTGFTAVTFLLVLPLTQVMVIIFGLGDAVTF
jgi:hypothetical protein